MTLSRGYEPPVTHGDDESRELQRAATLFPKTVIWLIGLGILLLLVMAGAVYKQVVATAEEVWQQVTTHDTKVNDHEARIRILEQQGKDLKDTAKETRDDVREIRRLIETQQGQPRRDATAQPSRRPSP